MSNDEDFSAEPRQLQLLTQDRLGRMPQSSRETFYRNRKIDVLTATAHRHNTWLNDELRDVFFTN